MTQKARDSLSEKKRKERTWRVGGLAYNSYCVLGRLGAVELRGRTRVWRIGVVFSRLGRENPGGTRSLGGVGQFRKGQKEPGGHKDISAPAYATKGIRREVGGRRIFKKLYDGKVEGPGTKGVLGKKSEKLERKRNCTKELMVKETWFVPWEDHGGARLSGEARTFYGCLVGGRKSGCKSGTGGKTKELQR